MKAMCAIVFGFFLTFTSALYAGDMNNPTGTVNPDSSEYVTTQQDTAVDTPAGMEQNKPIDLSTEDDKDDKEKEEK